jgi:hypothetical protein
MSDFHIDLDFVLEETRNKMNRVCVQGELRAELKKRAITSRVLQENGPAGGNPLVRLYGTRRALETYVREEYCKENGAEDAEFHIGFIKRNEGRSHGQV